MIELFYNSWNAVIIIKSTIYIYQSIIQLAFLTYILENMYVENRKYDTV